MSYQKEASEEQPRHGSTRLLFSSPSGMAAVHKLPIPPSICISVHAGHKFTYFKHSICYSVHPLIPNIRFSVTQISNVTVIALLSVLIVNITKTHRYPTTTA